ncbi:hypothetical protein PBI_SCHIEBS_20 [Gordonia phage Schiebs]|nr:hypothetical protein PBI_SCHIEBS_20 [Gordonia phage Schiebs]
MTRLAEVEHQLDAALTVAQAGLDRALAAEAVDSTNPYAYAYGYLTAAVSAALAVVRR